MLEKPETSEDMRQKNEQILNQTLAAARRAQRRFWFKEIVSTLLFFALMGLVAWGVYRWSSKRPSEKLTEGHWGMVRACDASGNLAVFTPDSHVACIKRESVVWVYVPGAK